MTTESHALPRVQNWGSRFGVILAVTGSAVGLGNFLRFPGVACANGGGAFMIPYLVAFVVVGLPIAWVEWAMGRYAGRQGYSSAPGIFRVIAGRHPLAAYGGVLALIVPVIIYMFYVSVEAWCLGFAWHYWSGGMVATVSAASETAAAAGKAPDAVHAAGVAAASSYLLDFAGVVPEEGATSGHLRIWREFTSGALPFLLVCFAINFVLIYRGINKGIEWFCTWAMPALVLCALIILVAVLSLGAPAEAEAHTIYRRVAGSAADQTQIGVLPELREVEQKGAQTWVPTGVQLVPQTVPADVDHGLGFMWNPVGHRTTTAAAAEGPVKVVVEIGFWQSLANPQTWLAAAGQIFFSLSVGLGVIITYASYSRPNDDIALSATTAAAGNTFFEVALGGMMVIPAAFIFVGPTELVTAGEKVSSISLGFFALPGVFENMPAGHFFGGLFFFLLFLAAVTSSLSMLQPAIAFLEEGLGLGRRASVSVLGLVTGLGAAFVALVSGGLTVLDHLDFWTANLCIFLLATFEVILFAWVLGIEKGLQELARGAEMPLPVWLPLLLKWITPIFLLTVFCAWIAQQINEGSYLNAVAEDPLVQVVIAFIGVNILFFGFLVAEALHRWRHIEEAQA